MTKQCKHKNVIRFKTYEPGDFYYFHKKCKNCGKEVGAWTIEEAESKEIK